eukprot:scaffold17830_cov67-Skeletonema_dohrnii-CCMP3373.AAC.1
MAIKTDMPHVVSLLRDVSAGDRRIYCGRRLLLSPLLHGDRSRHNAGCLTLELGRYGWPDSTPQRHDDDESSVRAWL